MVGETERRQALVPGANAVVSLEWCLLGDAQYRLLKARSSKVKASVI